MTEPKSLILCLCYAYVNKGFSFRSEGISYLVICITLWYFSSLNKKTCFFTVYFLKEHHHLTISSSLSFFFFYSYRYHDQSFAIYSVLALWHIIFRIHFTNTLTVSYSEFIWGSHCYNVPLIPADIRPPRSASKNWISNLEKALGDIKFKKRQPPITYSISWMSSIHRLDVYSWGSGNGSQALY